MDFKSASVYVFNGGSVPEEYSLGSLEDVDGKAYEGFIFAFANRGDAAIKQGFTRASADNVRQLAKGWDEKGFRIERAVVNQVSAEVRPNERLNNLVESFRRTNG